MSKKIAIVANDAVNLDAIDSAIAEFRATGHRAVRIERGYLVAGLVARGFNTPNAEAVKAARAWAVDGGLNKGTLSTLTGIVFGSERSKRAALIPARKVAELVVRIVDMSEDSITAAEKLGELIGDKWQEWTNAGKDGKPRKSAAEKSDESDESDESVEPVAPEFVKVDAETVLDMVAVVALEISSDVEFQAFADAVALVIRQATIDRKRAKQGKAPQKTA